MSVSQGVEGLATGAAAALAAGLAGAALLIAATLALLGPRLARAMAELSGAAHRAQWWTRLCCAALAIGSLAAALLGYWWHGTAFTLSVGAGIMDPPGAPGLPFTSAGRDPDAFWAVVDILRWTLAALLVSLVAISAVVLTSMATASAAGGSSGAPQRDA